MFSFFHSSGDTTERNVNSGEERKLKHQLGGTSTTTQMMNLSFSPLVHFLRLYAWTFLLTNVHEECFSMFRMLT